MVTCKAHGHKSSYNRLYLSRKEGSRGLTSVELMWEREVGKGGGQCGHLPKRQRRQAGEGNKSSVIVGLHSNLYNNNNS